MQREAGEGGAHPHLCLLFPYGALTHHVQEHADSVILDELCCEVIQKTFRRPGHHNYSKRQCSHGCHSNLSWQVYSVRQNLDK